MALVTVLQNPVLPSLTQLPMLLGSVQISLKLQCISHMKCDKVHCSVKHDCLDAGVVQVVTMTVLSTSYKTLACVNNIGV